MDAEPAAAETADPSATEGDASTPEVFAPDSSEPVADAAAAVAPAVVQIETPAGLGSGVIYDSSGLILTAAHVLQGARDTVTVRLADGTTADGQVLGFDLATDVAVVQIEGRDDLPVAELALGDPVQVGQLAVAVGSPFGLDQTVTAGVISAIDRAVPTEDGAVQMLQTDAPINSGNSGGPLADRAGRVIGINDAIRSTDGSNAGVGFAIPIDVAKASADRIIAGEPTESAFLGVQTAPASDGDGALIVEVVSGSPADDAGLERGDRITSIDGEPVGDPLELVAQVRAHRPGDEVELAFERDGEERTATVTLAEAD